MSKERIIGIDFGTSTSVIRVKNYDENGKPIGDELFTQSVTFNHGSSMVPSVIRKVNNVYAFGHEADIAARNAEYFRSFKIDLQSDDETKKEQAKKLVQEFFKYLYNEYNHQLITGNLGDTDSVNKTIVSYPVKWDPEMELFMIETAEKAGFENVSGMDEAEAAIRAVTVQCKDIIQNSELLENGKTSNVMLIDMGAGTTDIVISKYVPDKDMKNEIITTWPNGGDILFGGREVDIILRDFLVSLFPQEYREKVEKRLSVDKMKAWKENTVSPALAENQAIDDSYEAYDIAERFDIDYEDFSLDREQFENICHNYISQFVKLVNGAINKSKLSPEDIDLVILTGGHSKWYFVKELLLDKNETFEKIGLEKIKANPERILSVALPQETVALGLVYSKISGTIAFDKRKHLEDLYDSQKSIPALKMAANMESPKAINELGYYYATGEGGIAKDRKKAMELYQKAADMDYVTAWYNLGCCYFEDKNYKEAVNAFSKASDSINEAAFNLGVCYHHGLGVQQDEEMALKLYKQASDNGYAEAKNIYEELFKVMHPKQTKAEPKPYTGSDPIEYAQYLNSQLLGDAKENKLYVGEESVPQYKKIKFLSSFRNQNIQGKWICYHDDTAFDGGKDGFLITTKVMLIHEFLGNPYIIDVTDIDSIIDRNNCVILIKKDGTEIKIPVAVGGAKKEIWQTYFTKLIYFIKKYTD
ncbi:MAG: SEL1-like repeat protein [Eubacterium sp.]|nr:SEL1-like repeat protein [Eubacterium sp.]